MENLSQQPCELVVLLLKDVMFRHTEFRSLEDFLVEKYGFNKIEEKEHKISELKHLEGSEKKFSFLKIYEGIYLESKIGIYMLGDTSRKEDVVVEAGGEEQYTVYTVKYQMIKLISESGYAIQQLIERLTVDLGIDIKLKEWVFRRCMEG